MSDQTKEDNFDKTFIPHIAKNNSIYDILKEV